jgi:hypothetical protein
VRLPGRPVVGKVRDFSSEKRSYSAGKNLAPPRVVEGAARELGKRFEIHRRSSGAPQCHASKVPELAADTPAAVSWQHMDHIDLDRPQKVLLARWAATDKPNYLIRDGGHEDDPI